MNAFVSTVTQKGQVTIPKSVRDSLHLVTGDRVEFVLNDRGEVVIKPVTRKVVEVAGLLSKYKKSRPVSIEEMDQAVAQYIRDEAL
ncbi:AbrB/MazE/SpoVT family DNA-binding domain-containing protein [uncultured Thiothrix sp.]|uniref:AbrB/MazE/SpoVT family DNA-binding domain-containing protein n=1 Tax=uncultured Thiothrix sp. TaxID=223185 RepID=UPI00262214BF|nr:AbrB/MazE/SpoVT family DNA-binding domain-containing protein [uncultured Thiothrix sp.]